MKSFEDCNKKRCLQKHVYKIISKRITSSILILPGSCIETPIQLAEKVASTERYKIYCIEKDKKIYDKIKRQYKRLPFNLRKKATIACGPVETYKDVFGLASPCKCIDLDLCRSLRGTSLTIASCLRRQSMYMKIDYRGNLSDRNLRKCLMFTASLRTEGGYKGFLQELNYTILREIKAEISIKDMTQGKRLSWGLNNKHMFYELPIKTLKFGRLLKTNGLSLYIYKDTSSMVTCVIMYK